MYKRLKLISLCIARIPGVKSYTDFELLVEVGYLQSLGTPPTTKQILLLGIASRATMRRHLDRLCKEGIIVRTIPPNDHRTAHLSVNPNIVAVLEHCVRELHDGFCDC